MRPIRRIGMATAFLQHNHMKSYRVLAIFLLTFWLVSCSTASNNQSTNADLKRLPIESLHLGKSYSFTLKQKVERPVGGYGGGSPTRIEQNQMVFGKLVEIDSANGWLKIENRKGDFEFVHFTDVERFSELVPSPVNTNSISR